jgi:hypothetical protein
MKFDWPDLSALQNESNVEQKLVYPPLVAEDPFGFGIAPNEILSKKNIRRLTIGKGSDRPRTNLVTGIENPGPLYTPGTSTVMAQVCVILTGSSCH